MHNLHAVMKTPPLPSPQQASWPLSSPPRQKPTTILRGHKKNWHVKAQKRKGLNGSTLPAENGNLFGASSKLHPSHSTRFVDFEVLPVFEN